MDKLLKNKVFQRATNTVASVILAVSIIICFLVITSVKSETGMPKLFGHSFLSVQSDSMEDTFFVGDLIIVKVVDDNIGYSDQVFEEGDIITFQTSDDDNHQYINTHRIVEVITGKEGERVRYVTKGDNVDQNDKKYVYNANLIGGYTGKKYEGLGKAFDFVKSSEGVLFCVVLPAALVIIWQIYVTVYGYMKKKNELLLAMEAQAAGKPIPGSEGSVPPIQPGAAFTPQQLQAMQALGFAPQQFGQQLSFSPQQLQAMQAQVMQMQMSNMQQFGTFQPTAVQTGQPIDEEAEKMRIINEFIAMQKAEESKKQAIIEEYLAQQKAAEEAAKVQAAIEQEKIKVVISEYLSQMKNADQPATPATEENAQEETDSQADE